ncbi:late embryogenesis abundant protein At1g64065 [Momordica charantia]|uniref:Late embryogenesis abundant protein At1g64065 n=1 Tax=Momordica charantia TaxID=3673 RepID=A0A6J1CZG8_MOMCH|nr:late embryogenesis abundant protein At1g64065 [Momordica charantia]
MNGISLAGAIPEPGSKSTVSLTADVSVKNPNTAMFKYSNTTTTLYIGETVVGEARGPSGQARPHRTARMNITVNIIAELLLSNINVSAGTLQLRSFSRIPGRVKMLHFIRKHIVVKMNCTVVINVLSRSIEDQKCMKRVKL